MISLATIQQCTARRFDIPMREMVSARRHRSVARPRQVAMYLSRELTPRSLPEIGRRFGGRDHTTVIHAIERIEALRADDAALDRAIRLATLDILAPQHELPPTDEGDGR